MTVLTQIGALFSLMAIGFLLGKLRIVEGTALKGLSNLIIKAALPALILTSLQRPFSPELFSGAMLTLVVATVFYLGMILLSYAAVRLLKTPKRQVGALVFSLAFSNAGFVGFPVVVSILGQDSLFLAAIHNILFNLLAFSVGIAIVSGTSERGETDKKYRFGFPLVRLLNVNVVAALVGFALFVGSITLPRAVAMPLELLGSTTTPLAMIVVGLMLARTPLKAVVGDWRLYAVTALRLGVWPFVTWAACRAAGVGFQLTAITVIMAGMPAASNTSLIAEVYGGDTETGSSIIFITTLLSVATIPILAVLLT